MGKPGIPSSQRALLDRREQVTLLLAKGYSPKNIATILRVGPVTIKRDMKWINKQANDDTNAMAREGINAMYQGCIRSLNELLTEVWRIYSRARHDNKVTFWHRVALIRLGKDITDSKFAVMSSGPAMLELNRLESELVNIKRGIEISV